MTPPTPNAAPAVQPDPESNSQHAMVAAEADQILKVDTLGRVRVSGARREALLGEFNRSGMSGQAFAKYAGIKYQTLACWVQRRRKQEQKLKSATLPKTQPVRWLEAVVEGEAPAKTELPTGILHVQLPGGARLEIGSVEQAGLAAELIRALEKGGQPC